ncbi:MULTISPECIES: hypothetical protein [unclassified Granulicatella]|uniref:hypothetical protein n=1 Tax=unclassified Granulicatella TaxID=2630493 RepID=UPI001072F608|nr:MULTISPECIES: hypothetical protein [unclassified Granulicatella]MBF0780600.1 hypothetical protein [Granulicatella sp. 19428wC4_WM01]TFU94628.1 hypothetical protein E4T68_05755 [Granulicatella sp. WM01]
MELVAKLVTVLGTVAVVIGLFWAFSGFIDYLQGRKNKDKNKQDDGLESIIYGGVLAAVSASISAAIIAALNSITF